MNFQWPPESNWPEMLCAKLGGERKTGQVNHPNAQMLDLILFSPSQRLNIIIVSEGAIDRDGNPITADAVKKVFVVVDKIESQSIIGFQVVVDKLKQDTRVTVLGHVQVFLLLFL